MRVVPLIAFAILVATAVAQTPYPASDVPAPPPTTYAPGAETTTYEAPTSPSYPTMAPYTVAPGEYYKLEEHYHRQLYHAEVKVDDDGWIHYCPEGHDWYGTATYEYSCNSFRPWNFRELDYWGNVTMVDYASPAAYRQAVSLRNWTYIATSRNSSLPMCWSNGTAGPDPCGMTDAGAALWYATLPVTIELYEIAEGSVQIDARVYLHRGWYWAGGKNYSVYPGTATYDVSVQGYKFAEYGWTVNFDIQYKYPEGSTTVGTLTAEASDALTTPNSRIVCAPQYRVSNGSLALSGKWADAWVRLRAPNNASQPDLIASYKFEGPFLNLRY